MDSYLFQEYWSEVKKNMVDSTFGHPLNDSKLCFLLRAKVLKSQIIPSCASPPFLITAVIARFTGLTALNQIMRAKFLWRHESYCIVSRNRFLSPYQFSFPLFVHYFIFIYYLFMSHLRWTNHVTWMEDSCLPKTLLSCEMIAGTE